ncbi:MAG: MBL fold metallo-hydrolase [Gemmataceae bacterium]
MTLRYTALASGSRGNSSLVQVSGTSLLIDAGLPLQELEKRCLLAGKSLAPVQAILLTHTHSDHWNDGLLGWLCRERKPLFCHPSHHSVLARFSRHFDKLHTTGLLRSFEPGTPFEIAPGVTGLAVPVRHDGGETFGFRIDGPRDLFGQGQALAHLSDLGTWDDDLAESMAEVDLLAVEFNHDLILERQSTRPAFLVARVLSDEGHLSNDQAARFLQRVLSRTTPGRLRHVVQLHLSEDCNRPALARKAASDILREHEFQVQIQTAEQYRPGRTLHLNPGLARRRVVGTAPSEGLPPRG